MSRKSKLEVFQQFVVLLSKSAGREQTCRLIQYFAMFMGNTLKDKDLTQKILVVGGQMSATRKVLRFGKEIALYINFVNNIKTYLNSRDAKDPFNKAHNGLYLLSSMISNCWSMLFFLTDHVIWFCNIGIVKNPELKKTVDWWSDFSWIWESVFDALCASIEFYLLHKKWITLKMKNSQDEAEFDRIKARVHAVKKDFIKAVLNIPIAYGFVTGKVARQKMGALGTVTSLIGINQIWA